MKKVNGNTTATIQIRTTETNAIGEGVQQWSDALSLFGWLDYSGGQNDIAKQNAKVQETTHIFICDYQALGEVTSENARMVINDCVYQILDIDNPMFLNYHLEFYLKYIGGGQGV